MVIGGRGLQHVRKVDGTLSNWPGSRQSDGMVGELADGIGDDPAPFEGGSRECGDHFVSRKAANSECLRKAF